MAIKKVTIPKKDQYSYSQHLIIITIISCIMVLWVFCAVMAIRQSHSVVSEKLKEANGTPTAIEAQYDESTITNLEKRIEKTPLFIMRRKKK